MDADTPPPRASAVDLPVAPDLPGHFWREVHPDDMPAIRDLQVACAEVHGTPVDKLIDYTPALGEQGKPPVGDAICAVDADGRLSAFGWVRVQDVGFEHRVGLFGEVRPAYRRRGLGTFVLQWTEARGRQLISQHPEARRAVLRLDFTDTRPDAVRLYERLGFRKRFTEHRMRRNLHAPDPDYALPEGVTILHWAPERSVLFHDVYRDAWSTRPSGPGWTAEEWIAYYADDPDFRPDLTLLAMCGDEGIAFIRCDVTDEREWRAQVGWIAHLGVRREWRGRGMGFGLLSLIMQRLCAEGLEYAELDVGSDNPDAKRLYERAGFTDTGHRTLYAKDA